ncbi:hypothetical protein [Ammoniphilus sp. CFH 90114]|uniref:hypothetical protein n=1 Tax=Ammoniphilus sp. CFH 90114 TaxID=2493665 RepID=UPI00100EF3F3|nr:hypothetical protein [Ammoniphilus sp. CFH 90114]RXT02869.1 hypothetical protein EIZ39_24065 [Ammoniphilus sp. CFH 90114]
MFRPNRRKQQLQQIGWLSLAALLVATLITFYLFPSSSPSSTGESLTPQQVVEQFYQYEQTGDFGSSWELFHPLMKEKFSKESYIQQRAHVFMQHFDVTTFDYQLGDPVLVQEWKMGTASPALPQVYKVPVTLFYPSGIFGDFSIQQDVFLALEETEYRILWPYSQ